MAISNDSVKADLVKVGSLELQHLVNTSPVDTVCGLSDLLGSSIRATEASADELLAVLVKQVECIEVSTC